MRVGDLVRLDPRAQYLSETGSGVVVAQCGGTGVVVFWNDRFPFEVEDGDYLEVISESR